MLDLLAKSELVFSYLRRVELPYPWVEHIPFPFFLVDILRPKLLVELGSHTGNSYNAFCQAVELSGSTTKCNAVDTWQGDVHAGEYQSSIYEDLRSYQESTYSGFSTLLRLTFDEALPKFADRSIDLLHIDGLHTYEAVKHDFDREFAAMRLKWGESLTRDPYHNPNFTRERPQYELAFPPSIKKPWE